MEWFIGVVLVAIVVTGAAIDWKGKDTKLKSYEICLEKKDTNCKDLLK